MPAYNWKELAPKYKKQKKLIESYHRRAKKIENLREEFLGHTADSLQVISEKLAEEAQLGGSRERLLNKAFALVGEMSHILRNEYPYTVQFMASLAMSEGKIVEMENGEGKSLAAILTAYFHILSKSENKGNVHIVSDNGYLVKRDARRYGKVLYELGLSVAAVWNDGAYILRKEGENYVQARNSPKEAYKCDVVYVDKARLILDYLYDHHTLFLEEQQLRGLDFAIVDEADSILIDEARRPIRRAASSTKTRSRFQERFQKANTIVTQLIIDEDYIVDEEDQIVELTLAGEGKVCQRLGIHNIYDNEDGWYYQISIALIAHNFWFEQKQYLVSHNKIVPVDAKTGRPSYGSRFEGALHCALEAKHNLPIRNESSTYATITVQNFFKQYQKLTGMTGTGFVENDEFTKVYDSTVVCIPPRFSPSKRNVDIDQIYGTKAAKLKAVARAVWSWHKRGNPILIATQNVKEAKEISRILNGWSLRYQLLTAEDHSDEARKIEGAGVVRAITISAKMAGRGTDIAIEPNSIELGGLVVLVTERQSLRIDEQLAGRTARRGQPGYVQFFLSLEDDLMRRFGGERLKNWMSRGILANIPEDEPLKFSVLDRLIENAQERLRRHDFRQRQEYYLFDRILDDQRTYLYRLRQNILNSSQVDYFTNELVKHFTKSQLSLHLAGKKEQWDLLLLREKFEKLGIVERKKFYGIGDKTKPEIGAILETELLSVIDQQRQKNNSLHLPENPEQILLLVVLNDAWSQLLEQFTLLTSRLAVRTAGYQPIDISELAHESQALFLSAIDSAQARYLNDWSNMNSDKLGVVKFLADTCRQHQQWTSLIELLQRLVEHTQNVSEQVNYLSEIARIYAQRLNEPDKAIAILENAISSSTPSTSNIPELYNLIGQVFYDHGEYKQAIECFEKSYQLEPNGLAVHWTLASYQNLEEYEMVLHTLLNIQNMGISFARIRRYFLHAIQNISIIGSIDISKVWDVIIDTYGERATRMSLQVGELLVDKGEYAQAKSLAEHTAARFPNILIEIYNRIGFKLFQLAHYMEAKHLLSGSIAKKSQQPIILYRIIICSMMLGEYAEASNYIEQMTNSISSLSEGERAKISGLLEATLTNNSTDLGSLKPNLVQLQEILQG